MTEFKSRRENLYSKMANSSVAVLPANKLVFRNNDTEYAFRQNSDFYYLTGFNEPDAILILEKDKDAKTTYTLFTNPCDPKIEIWIGKRAGIEGAKAEYGADEAFDIKEFDTKLSDYLANKEKVYYPFAKDDSFSEKINHAFKEIKAKVRTGAKAPNEFADVLPLIHEMRLFKSENEIELLRQAAQISAAAHKRLMQKVAPDMMEYQLEAELLHHCCSNGLREQAYTPIVGSGENSCVLHYIENNKQMKDGQLVLVDAGGELQCYASDITRTYPVNGKFTLNQAKIYDIVLKSQLAGIEQVKPGNTWDSIQDAILEVIIPGLIELGLLKGSYQENLESKGYEKFYMHKSGHWLGLDVHDVGSYKVDDKWRKLEPGMVLTVEPGIYISEKTQGIDKAWHQIGVRIEDDVLVTKDGNEVLSQDVPKTIEEIEALSAS